MSAESGNENKSGSVLVIGGGVGGVQSALDLADAGYKVYLVEEKDSIGGLMAQLDKTFPTNDCSMCILAPKLVDAGNHPNIEIMASTDVLALDGESGRFEATVLRRARFIDPDKCTGCGICSSICPVELPSLFNAGLGTRKATDRLYPQAVPNSYVISKNGRAPCSGGCPIDMSVQAYVNLIAAGQTKKAAEIIRRENPLPGICGRVCYHPCEDACNRGGIDEPINIRALKRYAIDRTPDAKPKLPPATGKSVAVVGSGPAGLAAAHGLAFEGHRVVVYEALPVTGGMLRVGVPRFRLPDEALDRDIEYIRQLGVEFKTSTVVGRDVSATELEKSFDAVFLATGVHESRKLDVPGENASGVMHGIDFLRRHALGEKIETGSDVVVVGGGNTAIDSARTARRLGAHDVTVLYRRTRSEMPAAAEEVEAALAEGIRFEYLAAPVQVLAERGRVVAMDCIRMELGEPDASGRRSPVPVEGSLFTIKASLVIPAISQMPVQNLAALFGVDAAAGGTIRVDALTLQTSRPKVFSGGDVVAGPSSVIESIENGKRAARAISNLLNGKSVGEGMAPRAERPNPLPPEEIAKRRKTTTAAPRVHPEEVAAEERAASFAEVEHVLTDAEAKAEAARCLNCADCCECFRCAEVCKAGAIDHLMQDRIEKLEVGAVILALGTETFNPALKPEFGYGVCGNVVSSLQFERILCASGPYGGHVERPSDGVEPRRIAFIQCVGSRDISCDREYCSSVCCTYATKEAILAREHIPGAAITIFGMDFRTHGKDFEKFMLRAQGSGVRYVRSRVPAVEEDPSTRNLLLSYESTDGRRVEEEFDLVVLSVGLQVPEKVQALARKLGVQLDEYGFAASRADAPLETSRRGIFVCGAFESPKDIPETVVQASAAAAAAAASLAEVRGTRVGRKEYPPERDIRTEEPRIGVFVCSCGSNIAGVVDVKAVRDMAKTLDNVVWAENLLYTCSADALSRIQQRIEKLGLNRVVVSACSPRTHERLFQETIREAGLNRYLFEQANIRDHCSWVHRDHPEAATQKAKDLVRGAVAKVRLAEPLSTRTFAINQSALVMGGGVAGMTAALSLAEQGFHVTLVEKRGELGGLSRRIDHTIEGSPVGPYIDSLERRVLTHEMINVCLSAEVTEVSGSVGSFKAVIGDRAVSVGAIIVATGAREYQPTEYGYGQHPGVMTQMQLEERLVGGKADDLNDIVMIQCVGSRNAEQPNCSRICCAEAVKNAIAVRKLRPQARVTILYRDMRTFGLMEKYYREARELGVTFVRYSADAPPQVQTESGLRIGYVDPVLRREVARAVDAVVLSVGVRPAGENQRTAPMLKVPLTEDGYFFEAHVKLRPVDFSTDGIFVCGTAHGPKLIREAAVQGLAAASRAATILSKTEMETLAIVSEVDRRNCTGCRLCNTLCAYDSISFDEKLGVSVINAASCKGCGTCAANCPSGAITARNFSEEQLFAQIGAIAAEPAVPPNGTFEPRILAFLCNWCSYGGADLAGISRTQYPPNIRVVRVMCSGRVTPYDVLHALGEGFDGVWVSGCHPGDCHYTEGNYHARRRWMVFRELMQTLGFEQDRVMFSWISASENQKFADVASEVVEKVRLLGPVQPIRALAARGMEESEVF